MKQSNTEQPKREQREFWAVTTWGVELVDGYSCAPQNPEYWWCPEAGFSGKIGNHIFTNERDALKKAIAEREKASADALRIALKLSERLKTLEKQSQ